MVQKLGNIARRSAQCRHVVVCTHQIRRKRTWESPLKAIWDWESQPYQVSNMNHTLSKLPIKLHLLVCQVCCCAGARIILLHMPLYSRFCRAPNRAPMRAFFSRFVVHQIVLQCVLSFRGLSCTKSCSNACMLFFTACRAPTHAPMRAFFSGLSCTKSCSNACFFSLFVVHQIVFYFMVPGLVYLLGNCCWWFLCNVCNLQSFMKV